MRLPRMVIVGLLHVYRAVVSPWYGPTCRFYPSCSEYALVAVGRHGAIRGVALAGWRLLRCNPWNPGGVDHVPPVRAKRSVVAAAAPTCSHDDRPRAASSNSAPSDRRVA